MKVVSVVGVRPEFVMAMPISRAIPERHDEVLVHTGQHYDDVLSDVFFDELDLPEPSHELGVGSARRSRQVAQVRSRLREVFEAEDPDVVVVYGDTNSTLGGALAASEHGVTLAHVEAGVRCFDRSMPEERNRLLTDRHADLLLAPTRQATRNLRSEGVSGSVTFTGDVRRDAFDLVAGTDSAKTDLFDRKEIQRGGYVLATVHRAANTDDEAVLCSVLRGLASSRPPVVLPLHPRTERRLREYDRYAWADSQVTIVDPVGYPEFLRLVENAGCVATDSGGVQREAMLAETPCVTLRETTEWVETVRKGYNCLAGTDAANIARAIDTAFQQPIRCPTSDRAVAPRIIDVLMTAPDSASAANWRERRERQVGR